MSTPRTDKESALIAQQINKGGLVPLSFARTLETELQQAQAALAAVTLERLGNPFYATPATDSIIEVFEGDEYVPADFGRAQERALAASQSREAMNAAATLRIANDRDQLQAQVGAHERYFLDIREKAALIANNAADEKERFIGRQIILMTSSALAALSAAPAAPDSAKDGQ